jgi:hypothetical protein
MRTFSATAVRSILALETPDAFLLLLTLTDPVSGTQYRTALNTVDITSRGHVFTACYFEFAWPEDTDEAPPGCTLTIDNVDLGLVDLIRSITQPIEVMVELVVSAQPDLVEMQLTDLILREITWDQSTIQGTLMSDDPLNQKFPGDIYEPRTFPGLF